MPPWYDDIKQIVARTEPATNMALGILIIASILILLKGSPSIKALWVVYMISP
jgi:hypothetical protein